MHHETFPPHAIRDPGHVMWNGINCRVRQNRIGDVKIIDGENWKPVVIDDLVLIPNPRVIDSSQGIRVTFTKLPTD